MKFLDELPPLRKARQFLGRQKVLQKHLGFLGSVDNRKEAVELLLMGIERAHRVPVYHYDGTTHQTYFLSLFFSSVS